MKKMKIFLFAILSLSFLSNSYGNKLKRESGTGNYCTLQPKCIELFIKNSHYEYGSNVNLSRLGNLQGLNASWFAFFIEPANYPPDYRGNIYQNNDYTLILSQCSGQNGFVSKVNFVRGRRNYSSYRIPTGGTSMSLFAVYFDFDDRKIHLIKLASVNVDCAPTGFGRANDISFLIKYEDNSEWKLEYAFSKSCIE